MSYSASGDTGAQTITPVDINLTRADRGVELRLRGSDFDRLPGRQHRADPARHLRLRRQGRQRAERRRRRRDRLQPGQRPRPHGRRRRHARRDRPGRPARPRRRHDPGRRHLVRRGRAARRTRPTRHGPDRRRRRVEPPQVDQRPRRHAHGQPRQHDDRRLAPRLGPRGPGHQRQRLGLGVQPRARHPDGQEQHQAGQPRALRLVGRRGVRPGGRDPVRRGHLERGVREDRGEPQLRHARVAEPRQLRL